MSTDKQIEANRLNAQQSTGPRTPAGKAKVSTNALKHGITAQAVVLPGENPEQFDSFREDLLTSLVPQGALETEVAEKIVIQLWRLRRVPIFEANLFRRGCKVLQVRQARAEVQRYESVPDLGELLVQAGDRQAHKDAKQRLASASAPLNDPSFDLAQVLETSPGLSILERRENALERSWLRMQHELERLQAPRAGKNVPVPVVVDVNLSAPEPAAEDIVRTGPNGETEGNQK